jgi:erythromycin esterase
MPASQEPHGQSERFQVQGNSIHMNSTLIAELAERVSSVRLDIEAPLDDLHPLTRRIRDAKVVAIGSAVRTSHELLTLTQRLMRFMVDRHGYRSLALEGDETASVKLDNYVRSGEGDPQLILAQARSFLRFAEILDAIHWIRTRNEKKPDDQVRVVHASRPLSQYPGSGDIESYVANSTIAWHEQTGHRIVYWGGLAHTAAGSASGSNAGSHLRSRLASEYVSIALTFHHGLLHEPMDIPPAEYVESVLGAVDLECCLLEIEGRWSELAQQWLASPAKTRLVGPGSHELRGPPLRDWFDFIIHTRQVGPARPL